MHACTHDEVVIVRMRIKRSESKLAPPNNIQNKRLFITYGGTSKHGKHNCPQTSAGSCMRGYVWRMWRTCDSSMLMSETRRMKRYRGGAWDPAAPDVRLCSACMFWLPVTMYVTARPYRKDTWKGSSTHRPRRGPGGPGQSQGQGGDTKLQNYLCPGGKGRGGRDHKSLFG